MADRKRFLGAGLIALAAGNFAHGSANMSVVGLLNEIAADFQVSVGVAGQLGAAFQLSAAILAPVIAMLAVRWDRRTLLSAALVIVVLAQGAAALAPGFGALFAARMLGGAGTASYVPTSIATSALLVPPHRAGAAVVTTTLGFNLAGIIGVPFGVWLGGLFGWRWTLAFFGAMAVVALIGVRMTVPAKLPHAQLNASDIKRVLADRPIRAVLLFSFSQAAAQAIFYIYIAPLLREAVGAGPSTIALLMGWSGVMGLAGTLLGMRFIDRVGALSVVKLSLAACVAAMVLWPFARGSMPLIMVAMGLWGVGGVLSFSSVQAHLVRSARELAPLAIPCNTTMNFVGGTVGAVIGGVVVTWFGVPALSWSTLFMLAIATVMFRRNAPAAPPA